MRSVNRTRSGHAIPRGVEAPASPLASISPRPVYARPSREVDADSAPSPARRMPGAPRGPRSSRRRVATHRCARLHDTFCRRSGRGSPPPRRRRTSPATPASRRPTAPSRWTCSATRRPAGLDSCLRALRDDDLLVVWKLDRLGRNLAHRVNTVQDLSARGVGLRVLAARGRRSTPRPRPAASCSASSRRWPSSSGS